MGFFVQLTEAIAANQSLLVTGLDPNPEMLQSWALRRGMGGRSFLSQARHWIKAVIEATAPHVCAYKPSLGFYQALGPVGLELLREVRELVPLEIPLIVDAKHGDLNSSSALAHYLFRDLGADAATLSPLAGQDIAAPFLLYPEKAVVVTCHSSNPAARVLQHHPDEEDPLYLRIVRESQLWATPEQLLLEVGTSDPAILARVRREAPERFLILRSLWAEEDRLDTLLDAGLSASADGLLLPLPQNLLVEDDMAERAAHLKRRIGERRQHWLQERRRDAASSCALWLPSSDSPGTNGAAAAATGSGAALDPLEDLILDLFDIGCLLFGDYVQASGAVFNYYIDLRQIISDPNLFHRVLHSYAGLLQDLAFDRIAGIPYGSLPTATGLSLQLHKPLIYPRKEVKAHGARRLIEGDFNEGDVVALVDDILITGGSLLEGIQKLESSGLVVRDVVVFIDHGSGHGAPQPAAIAADADSVDADSVDADSVSENSSLQNSSLQNSPPQHSAPQTMPPQTMPPQSRSSQSRPLEGVSPEGTAQGTAAGSDALQRLAARGYRVRAVLDIARITAVLHHHGRLSDTQASVLSQGQGH